MDPDPRPVCRIHDRQRDGRARGRKRGHDVLPFARQDRATDPVRSFYLRGRLIAQELRDVGIDANCGPTCDIASATTHPFLMNRCLGRDPATVIAHAQATAAGYLAGGVLPIIKHIPGHGRTKVDSHLGLPTADVLHCNGDAAEMVDVVQAAGPLSPAAITRADRAIAARKTPDDVDISALEAEFATSFA